MHPDRRITSLAAVASRGLVVTHTSQVVPYPRLEDATVFALSCEDSECREAVESFVQRYPDATIWTSFPVDQSTEAQTRMIGVTGPRVEP